MSLRSARRATALALLLSLPGCGGAPKEPPPAAPPEGAGPTQAAADNEEAGGASTPEPEGAAGQVKPPPYTPFGLPECDGFLKKYRICVEEKIPADQRGKFEDDLRENRTRWWRLATMQQGTVAVGLACRVFAQTKKADLAVDYGCEF